MATIEERLTALEDRLAAAPLAAPPVTIGELTDVPAPGSPVASAWAQEVTNRSLHRFASKTALDAWAAANGSHAVTTDTNRLWQRIAGAWRCIAGPTPYFWAWPNGTQSAASGAVVTALWQGGEVDADNMFNGASGLFTVPAAYPGRWRFDLSIRWAASGAGMRSLWVEASSSASKWGQVLQSPAPAAWATVVSQSCELLDLAAGTTVQIKTYQDSGGALTLNSTLDERFIGRYIGP